MPLSINQIPIPVPSSTDPANFSARGDAVFGAFPDFITETNAVASEAAANRDSAEASKTAAANSETNAATYAANATTSANNASSSSVASLWVSGTTYSINDKRVSPITGQVYRRKTNGAGTTDPSLDSTNWYAVLLDADTQYPSIKPTLNLDFANSGKLDPRITFTRASTATYYDGKTFAKAEENLLTYSQEFDNAAWLKAGTTPASVTANAIVAPDGTLTASLLTFPGSLDRLERGINTTVGLTYVFSVYLKGTLGETVNIELGPSQATITFDGTWQRVSVSNTASTPSLFFLIIRRGTTASQLYAWGAQLEQRSSVTAYTPTTSQPITKYQPVLKTASNNEPRFDYDPVTLEAKGLLIEESRTNLILRSEDFTTAWGPTRASILSNQVIAPDGNLTADKFVEDTSNNSHRVSQSLNILVVGKSYTFSVYAKAGERSSITLYENGSTGTLRAATFNLLTGAVTGSSVAGYSVQNVGNGWYRCSISIPNVTNSTGVYAYIELNAGSSVFYQGDGSSGAYLWGAQLEEGSFPTSYIPTTSAAVTRQADNAVMMGTNFSSWYNQSEGTLCSEGNSFEPATSTNVRRHFSVSDGTSNNFIATYNYKNLLGGMVRTGATNHCDIGYAGYSQNAYSKMAIAYKVNDFAFSANGASPGTDLVGAVPTVTQAQVGVLSNTYLNGHIKRIIYYPKCLPNYQLQILTK